MTRNAVATIAALVPGALSETVALHPAHAAKLAFVTAKTGIPREQIIADLLDDHLFSLPEMQRPSKNIAG